jgi:transcriptional regulator with XRE-family HTH domain
LRELREGKQLSQGDIEKKTGLIRCYTSCVENGHTVPTVDTLEKYTRALEIPLYRFFYEGAEPPVKLEVLLTEEKNWGDPRLERFAGSEAGFLCSELPVTLSRLVASANSHSTLPETAPLKFWNSPRRLCPLGGSLS